MIRPFKYITSQHVVAGVTVMPQKRFRTKSKESPKRVLKHIWKDSTGLVQSENDQFPYLTGKLHKDGHLPVKF